MQKYELVADETASGLRVDAWISRQLPQFSRSAVQKLCEEGRVTVEGKAVGKSCLLQSGQQIAFTVLPPRETELVAQEIPLDIVYEDAHLLVVNKPKGMVVHPAPGNPDGTLVNALLAHCKGELSGINSVLRPGIVHRIDKDTSGLLIVAKDDAAHQGLAEQIKSHSFRREYEAVVYGGFRDDEGTVDAPIGRDPKERKRMAVTTQHARPAVTHYRVLQRFSGFTHLRLRLETGRTHQIRVHMAYIGHPVAGDPVYGPKKVITALHGQCLHAKCIGFTHPITQQYLEFESDLPDYFRQFLATLPIL
jgi:23S rRNA pseudouridine1911/1915/1917 synthase